MSYGKLHRWITIELSLPREQRLAAKHLMKEIRQQIDRLNETSSAIPPDIIADFNKRFKTLKEQIAVPEICNGLHKVDVYPTEPATLPHPGRPKSPSPNGFHHENPLRVIVTE